MSYETTTPNFGLPQWVGTDEFQMEDFNEAFLSIDEKAVRNNDYGFPLVAGTTAGTPPNYTLTLNPPLLSTAYTKGLMLCVDFHAAMESPEYAYLSINGISKGIGFWGEVVEPIALNAGLHILLFDGVAWSVLDDAFLPLAGGMMRGDIIPLTNGSYTLGTSARRWNSVYTNGLVLGGSNVADFVVEQGTNGIWKYRKWNSGAAECWGQSTQSLSGSNPVGNCYVKSGDAISLPPGLFSEYPIPNVNCYGPSYCHVTINTVTTSTISMYYITLISSTTTTTAFMHLSGRWK